MAHDFNTAILTDVAHRPWAMPPRPWVMTQTWLNLLFAHWPMDPRALRSKVPSAFELDVIDGDAWIGVVPFYMTNVTARGLPSVPKVSEFPELNVRTYVRVGDRPGVYFFSLDAGSLFAVHAARKLLNLPYHHASMLVSSDRDVVSYESRRKGDASTAALSATYWASGPVLAPVEHSLEYFLTERYCLYNVDRKGRPYRLEIHHPPWALQPGEAELACNTMGDAVGLTLPDRPPLVHFVGRQDTVAWPPDVL
jgi:uncharacterized protein YqjF (DUF2071 family)